MNKADLDALVSSVAVAVREFVADAVGAVTARVNGLAEAAATLDQRFAALPVPEKGAPGSSAFQIACLGGFQGSEGEWLESLRGKDADPVEVSAIVAQVVAQMPKPEARKDAEVDYERVGQIVKGMMQSAIAAFPFLKECGEPSELEVQFMVDRCVGKSYAVSEAVSTELAKAVAALPKPENGKDADPELVRAEVAKAVADIPRPENGKDADPADIARAVADAVAAIPRPKDAEVDYERIGADVKHLVSEAVAAIPIPKDGDSVELDAVREMVVAEVGKIPPAKPGKNADPVHPDTLALLVVTEVTKAVEKAVAGIQKPKDGDDGRDAIQCEPLLSIDEAKGYPRGTYASHRGGMIRSFRQTDPLNGGHLTQAGWAVMVNGIDSESEETLDDGRTDKRVTRYTDGTILERTIARAVVIDRGVYREGEKYAKGDGVTWGGSFYIAQCDNGDKPGDGSGFWRLAVKKGRDLTK